MISQDAIPSAPDLQNEDAGDTPLLDSIVEGSDVVALVVVVEESQRRQEKPQEDVQDAPEDDSDSDVRPCGCGKVMVKVDLVRLMHTNIKWEWWCMACGETRCGNQVPRNVQKGPSMQNRWEAVNA